MRKPRDSVAPDGDLESPGALLAGEDCVGRPFGHDAAPREQHHPAGPGRGPLEVVDHGQDRDAAGPYLVEHPEQA